MLTPQEFEEVMNRIELWSYETDDVINEDSHTYSPSSKVCDVENITEILKNFVLPF